MALLPSLFVHAMRTLGDASDDQRLDAAQTWLSWARETPHRSARAITLASFADGELADDPGRPVRIAASIAGASRRVRRRRPSSDRDTTLRYGNAQRFVLRDRTRATITTLDVVDPALLAAIARVEKRGEVALFSGRFFALPADGDPHSARRPWVFHLEEVEPLHTRVDRLAATKEEIASTRAWLRKHRDVIAAMLAEIRAHRPRPPAGAQPLIDAAIECVVVQSLSCGVIGKTRGQIQIGVFGPPGLGKQSLHDAAEMLNDPCVRLLASGMTDASLVGRSIATADGYVLEPGLIDLADGGVLGLEDLQAMSASTARRSGDVFNAIATTGVLPAGKLGSREREYAIRLLVDGNPEAQLVMGGKGRPRGARLHEQFPFLGRLDGLFVLDRDDDEAWDAAARLLGLRSSRPEARAKSARKLAIVAAWLCDRFPEIDLAPVSNELRAAFTALRTYASEHAPSLRAAELQPARIQLTLQRLCAAHARSAQRAKATKADVRWALAMTEHRIAGMEKLLAGSVRETAVKPSFAAGRIDALIADHAGEVMSIEAMREALAKRGVSVSIKTLRRDAQAAGWSMRERGRYQLPPS
jgi:hypothetical protein